MFKDALVFVKVSVLSLQLAWTFSKLPHLLDPVDDLRLRGRPVLVHNLDGGQIASTGSVLLELDLVVNKKVHKPLFFFRRQKTKHESLLLPHC